MNVCFITSNEVSPEKGGIERITHTLAQAFSSMLGWKCYSIYSFKLERSVSNAFVDSRQVTCLSRAGKNISQLLDEWNIDALINQSDILLFPYLKRHLKKRTSLKKVFCHHFQSGWEAECTSIKSALKTLKKSPTLKNLIVFFLMPFFLLTNKWRYGKAYKTTYEISDIVVLLSDKMEQSFMKYGNICENQKFRFIPNCLSFDSFYEIGQLQKKEKIVLVVSRMSEIGKRIFLALKIWGEIESLDVCTEWRLMLVGKGDDLKLFKRYVKDNNLQRVVFEGSQPSEPYYKKSSLFMMTSEAEAWGLTLTEAQQNGCVPVAFDTYVSLHDVIEDNYNGFLIKDGNLAEYVSKMVELMQNPELRFNIAKSAIESSHRFEKKVVVQKWYEVLSDLCEK